MNIESYSSSLSTLMQAQDTKERDPLPKYLRNIMVATAEDSVSASWKGKDNNQQEDGVYVPLQRT